MEQLLGVRKADVVLERILGHPDSERAGLAVAAIGEEKCVLAIGGVLWHVEAMRVEDIADAALELPSEARALLADCLVESLDPAEGGAIHDLWSAEVNRRLHELRSGQVIGIPGEEAIARLRQKYSE